MRKRSRILLIIFFVSVGLLCGAAALLEITAYEVYHAVQAAISMCMALDDKRVHHHVYAQNLGATGMDAPIRVPIMQSQPVEKKAPVAAPTPIKSQPATQPSQSSASQPSLYISAPSIDTAHPHPAAHVIEASRAPSLESTVANDEKAAATPALPPALPVVSLQKPAQVGDPARTYMPPPTALAYIQARTATYGSISYSPHGRTVISGVRFDSGATRIGSFSVNASMTVHDGMQWQDSPPPPWYKVDPLERDERIHRDWRINPRQLPFWKPVHFYVLLAEDFAHKGFSPHDAEAFQRFVMKNVCFLPYESFRSWIKTFKSYQQHAQAIAAELASRPEICYPLYRFKDIDGVKNNCACPCTGAFFGHTSACQPAVLRYYLREADPARWMLSELSAEERSALHEALVIINSIPRGIASATKGAARTLKEGALRTLRKLGLLRENNEAPSSTNSAEGVNATTHVAASPEPPEEPDEDVENDDYENEGIHPSTPVGRKHLKPEARIQQGLRKPTFINGRQYSRHAVERMQERGFTPTVVENVIKNGTRLPDPYPGRIRCEDMINNIRVIIRESNGGIISLHYITP